MEKNSNLIKVRDIREPLRFNWDDNSRKFVADENQYQDFFTDNCFSKNDLRIIVEPWLSSLFQSEHLALLVGSGLTSAVQTIACGNADNGMDSGNEFSVFSKDIQRSALQYARANGRNYPNIEDRIRVGNDLISGLRIIEKNTDYPDIPEKLNRLCRDLNAIMKSFAHNIANIEKFIVSADEENKISAFNKLVLFLMSFASRTGIRERLNIFTTNYDRLIEAGADAAGIRLIDRFIGALSPVFRSSRLDIDMHYNPPGIRGEPRYLEGVVHFTKLHGSLDWINVRDEIRRIGIPFGAESLASFFPVSEIENSYSQMMIYPNAAKDRETSEYPYVELFRDFASALCRPNSTLVTYGFSFGDDHINRVIRDMLTIPSTHLVIIAYDDSTGRIMDKYSKWGHQSQMTLLIGEDMAKLDDLVDYYLPKPSVDRASIRMADILRQRFNIPADKKTEGENQK